MEINNKNKLHGFFNFKVIRSGKVITDSGWLPNIVTNAGIAQVALLAGDATAVPFTYLEVGVTNTAPAVTDTALASAITDSGLARAAATVSRVTTTATNDTLQLYKEWSVTGTKTVVEAGVFNASSGPTMLARSIFTGIAVENGDKLQATYKVSFADDAV